MVIIMDNRNIRTGRIIPLEGYCDQPYIVKTDDGAWLMTVTTGAGMEGASGQHVVSKRSFDRGESWQDEIDVSPADLPESSYSVLYKTKYGRIYCFYNYNADNLRAVRADDPPFGGGLCRRVDYAGAFRLQVQRRPRQELVGQVLRNSAATLRGRPAESLRRRDTVFLECRQAARARRRGLCADIQDSRVWRGLHALQRGRAAAFGQHRQ